MRRDMNRSQFADVSSNASSRSHVEMRLVLLEVHFDVHANVAGNIGVAGCGVLDGYTRNEPKLAMTAEARRTNGRRADRMIRVINGDGRVRRPI
jgi:hypothetical protein